LSDLERSTPDGGASEPIGLRPTTDAPPAKERDAEGHAVDGRCQSDSNDHEGQKSHCRQPPRSAIALSVFHWTASLPLPSAERQICATHRARLVSMDE
jgi:hypothetical protein